MNQCKTFDSDTEDELSNSSDDNSDEDGNIHIKKSTFRKLGLYMHQLSQSYSSYESDDDDDEYKREIFTNIGIYMHQLSCEKATCYKQIMEKVFKELLSYFTNYMSDSDSRDSDLFFYLSDDDI
jgi:hypothetical protein